MLNYQKESNMRWTTQDPSTEEKLITYEEHSPSELEQRVESAQTAFKQWSLLDYASRAQPLIHLATLLKQNVDQYGHLMSKEMGKPIKQARNEILKCASACEYYANNGAEFLKDETVKTEATESYITFEPLGLILAIMPWNFPFWQIFRFLPSALIAGNGILLKHAPNVTGCAFAIEQLVEKAGFPKDLLKAILIETNRIPALIQDTRIQAITLTGSDRAGSEVAAVAGKSIKKCVLELGGSDPFIILDDADLNMCLDKAIEARMINTGQSCIASKRFIVPVQLQNAFSQGIKTRIEKLKIGEPADESTEIGPLARLDLLENLERQVSESVQGGARILSGGKRLPRKGYYYPPTLVVDVKKGMPLYQEEIFGPVFSVISVKNIEEAIAISNDSPFGLGASIWTKNSLEGQKVAKQIHAGNVFINTPVVSHVKLPFGGIKRSGYGRELSHYGIKEFVNIKSIYVK